MVESQKTNSVDIRCVQGHYEAYDDNNEFIVSGDTWNEVYNDLKEMKYLQ